MSKAVTKKVIKKVAKHKGLTSLWVLGILLFLYGLYLTRDVWAPALTPNPEKLKDIVWTLPTKQFLGYDIELRVGEFIAKWDWPDIVRAVIFILGGGVGGIVSVWKKYVTPLFNRVRQLEEENRSLRERLESLLLGKATPQEVAKAIKPQKEAEKKPSEKPAEEKKPEEEAVPTPEEVEKAIAILEKYRAMRGKK